MAEELASGRVARRTRRAESKASRAQTCALVATLLCPVQGISFSTVATNGDAASDGMKYTGAAVVGDVVYLMPFEQNNVGIFNTATSAFSTVATNGDAASGTTKYSGAAVVGDVVYCAPYKQNNVGIFNTATSAFSTVATTGDAASGTYKYNSAAAVGDVVYFTSNVQHNVGIFNIATSTFSTFATNGDAASGFNKYNGAAAVGDVVYLVPHNQNNVGIFNTAEAPSLPPSPPPSPPPASPCWVGTGVGPCYCANFYNGLTTDHVCQRACTFDETAGLQGVVTKCQLPSRPFIPHVDSGCPVNMVPCIVQHTPPQLDPCNCDSWENVNEKGKSWYACSKVEQGRKTCRRPSYDWDKKIGGSENRGCPEDMVRCQP